MARKKKRRPHGAGSIRTVGNRTIIQFYNVDGKRVTKSLPDLGTAQRLLALATKRVQDGLYGLGESHRTDVETLSQLAVTWLAARTAHESHYDDASRWNNHLKPLIGDLTPNEVEVSVLKTSMAALRTKGLGKATVKLCMALLSSFYSDLVEDGHAKMNPTKMLSKKTRREYMKSDHDPRDVPFIRDPSDIFRIYDALFIQHPSVALAYAIGALAGLRTSEIRALDWSNVSLERRTIVVREQAQRRKGKIASRLTADGKAPVKDREGRVVPILDALYPLLKKHETITGAMGLVCPAILGMNGGATSGPRRRFLGEHLIGGLLRETLAKLRIEPMIFYRAGRHTFASQWVLGGGTLEKLKEIMGHSSVLVSEKYAHLVPGRFTDADRGRIRSEVPTMTPAVAAEELRPAN